MLNGKAKEDFEKWLMDGNDGVSNFGRTIELTRVYFLSLKETCQQALIIDFFDGVGIYISVNYLSIHSDLRTAKGFQSLVCYKNLSTMFREVKTRTEATTQAIEKASEIFNQLNK
jgi:hypothetical protein